MEVAAVGKVAEVDLAALAGWAAVAVVLMQTVIRAVLAVLAPAAAVLLMPGLLATEVLAAVAVLAGLAPEGTGVTVAAVVGVEMQILDQVAPEQLFSIGQRGTKNEIRMD